MADLVLPSLCRGSGNGLKWKTGEYFDKFFCCIPMLIRRTSVVFYPNSRLYSCPYQHTEDFYKKWGAYPICSVALP